MPINYEYTRKEELSSLQQMSHSQLIALAREAFIQRYQNQQLLAALNRSYAEIPPPDEPPRTAARRQHRQIVEGEW